MRIAVIGGGAMGGALISGWIHSGWPAEDILVVEPDAGRAEELAASLGVVIAGLGEAAAADVVVAAVKPHQVQGVLAELAEYLPRTTVVVSIAAGLDLATLASALPSGQPVFRVMPNTPALVGRGMSGVAAGPTATAEQLELVTGLLNAVGEVLVVGEEQMDALTAISGSGPAYLFYVAEAMIEAGVHQGLTRDAATVLVNQTLLGAAEMAAGSGDSATTLRERVTSPAGTTAAALRMLDERGVRAAFLAAVQAAADRSAGMR